MNLHTGSLELDLTYLCNLKCNSCTRRCDLLPGIADNASPASIGEQFNSITKHNHIFKNIFLMGGEPTLYPHLFVLLDILNEYRLKTQKTIVTIVSNCNGPKVNKVLDSIPTWLQVRRAPKDGSEKHSTPTHLYWTMNVAPIDFPFFKDEDYWQGCMQQKRCGVQLATNNKWYACPMSGGIDRIFKLNLGVDSLEELKKREIFEKQLQGLCGLCGRFRMKYAPYFTKSNKPLESWFKDLSMYQPFMESLKEWPLISDQPMLSKSWKEAMEKLK